MPLSYSSALLVLRCMEQYRRSVRPYRMMWMLELSAVSREPSNLTFVQEPAFLRNPGPVKHVGVASLLAENLLMLKFYAKVETVLIYNTKQCTNTSNALVRDALKTKLWRVLFTIVASIWDIPLWCKWDTFIYIINWSFNLKSWPNGHEETWNYVGLPNGLACFLASTRN